ncbi:hypothetical protein FDECE_3597 [Fusarium decemcellulare]|nr:hypothetical protein FDECE_3597 [Fusarium decemcellulare]
MSTQSASSASEQDEFFDRLCRDSKNYPNNFIRGRLGASACQAAACTLEREAKKVFSIKPVNGKPVNDLVRFIEQVDCSHGGGSGQPKDTKTLDELVAHLQSNGLDPRSRYISIQSRSSKDRLNCSTAMFKYLCTYHQIPPSFLNCVYSFRTTLDSYDYNLAMFSDDNTLLARQEHTLPLDRLQRSGREIRYSFLLRSVEASESVPNQSWAIRQLAVYHSFDVVSGQTVWVTCKGNDVIEKRMKDAQSDTAPAQSNSSSATVDAFRATLVVLTMILDWCDDNWRWHINEISDGINKTAIKARTAKVGVEDSIGKLKTALTGLKESSGPGLSRTPTLESGIRLRNLVKGFSSGQNSSSADDSSLQLETDFDVLHSLKIFSFDELQRLQGALGRVQEALLVLKLNQQVIRQIRDHYQYLLNQIRVSEMKEIQEHCRNEIIQFCRHSRGVEANIEIRQAQLDSLLLQVQETKTLYDDILQYRSVQISHIYAKSSHVLARKMEVIAFKTKQETSSMHVITFVTLIFLPATFTASFFQSGILKWPEPEPRDPWQLNNKVFGLFMGLSVSMTALIILIWTGIRIGRKTE